MTYRTKRTFQFGWLLNNRLIAAVFVMLLVACAAAQGNEGPGPLNQAIRQELIRLGVLEADGSYTGGGSVGPDLDLSGDLTVDGNTTLGDGGVDVTQIQGYLRVFGPATFSAQQVALSAGVGSPTIIDPESGQHYYGTRFNNLGTTVKAACTLPPAAAEAHYYFDVVDTDGLRINAATGDTIRLGDLTCASAGYFESVRIGSSLHLVAVDPDTWVAVDGITGTWRADSTTSAGFAFTPHAFTATMSHSWDADADVSETALNCQMIGRELTMWGRINFTGAPPNTTLWVTLPNSWLVATSMDTPNGNPVLGFASHYDNGVGNFVTSRVLTTQSDRTYFYFVSGSTTTVNYSATSPITWANGDEVFFRVTIPVQ